LARYRSRFLPGFVLNEAAVFGLSSSEWIMVGIIFLIVFAAPRVGRLGEAIASLVAGKRLAPQGPAG
jgi:hypothetical protein